MSECISWKTCLKSLGGGLFAGAAVVAVALLVEQTLIKDLHGKL